MKQVSKPLGHPTGAKEGGDAVLLYSTYSSHVENADGIFFVANDAMHIQRADNNGTCASRAFSATESELVISKQSMRENSRQSQKFPSQVEVLLSTDITATNQKKYQPTSCILRSDFFSWSQRDHFRNCSFSCVGTGGLRHIQRSFQRCFVDEIVRACLKLVRRNVIGNDGGVLIRSLFVASLPLRGRHDDFDYLW